LSKSACEPGRSAREPLRSVIARFGLRADKRLGQHFLLDRNLLARIAAAAGDLHGRTVLEVGPGPGGLTRALLDAGATRIVAVERDPRCIAALRELALCAGRRLELIEADALGVALADLGVEPVVLVANLPYNIGTPLLLGWLDQLERIESMTLMFQREVAERLTAAPGTRSYGRLSVLVQWLCEARCLFHLPSRAFTPPPQVASTLVGLAPRACPLAPADKAILECVVAAAFGQRRKMLRSSLKVLAPEADALLERAGIPGTARAEAVPVEGFCRLAEAYRSMRDSRSFRAMRGTG
jgi:16S rRNA (adenine1518-N6/adenine1519-N6)-dimethyltransferase